MTINSVISAHRGQDRKTAIRLLCAATVLISLSFAHPSRADDRLKDFQNAINYMQDEEGCLSIPYPDRQASCVQKQKEVNKFCKESGPWSCGDVDPKEIQKDLERVKTDRDTLKAEKENLERQKSSLPDDQDKRESEDRIKETERRLNELDREREDLERQVSDRTRMVHDRLYIAKACRDTRSAVQEVFEGAKYNATQESDAEIAPLAKQLVKSWEEGERRHRDAIRNAENAIEICDKTLYEIGRLGNF